MTQSSKFNLKFPNKTDFISNKSNVTRRKLLPLSPKPNLSSQKLHKSTKLLSEKNPQNSNQQILINHVKSN